MYRWHLNYDIDCILGFLDLYWSNIDMFFWCGQFILYVKNFYNPTKICKITWKYCLYACWSDFVMLFRITRDEATIEKVSLHDRCPFVASTFKAKSKQNLRKIRFRHPDRSPLIMLITDSPVYTCKHNPKSKSPPPPPGCFWIYFRSPFVLKLGNDIIVKLSKIRILWYHT